MRGASSDSDRAEQLRYRRILALRGHRYRRVQTRRQPRADPGKRDVSRANVTKSRATTLRKRDLPYEKEEGGIFFFLQFTIDESVISFLTKPIFSQLHVAGYCVEKSSRFDVTAEHFPLDVARIQLTKLGRARARDVATIAR